MDITDDEPPPFWRSRGGVAFLVVVAVGGSFGDAWQAYAAVTPRFIPHFSKDERARPAKSR